MEDQVQAGPGDAPELVTLAVIAYNQSKHISEAIKGAFAQTYQPLEIILSDDGSDDDTFAIMEAMARSYSGPHRIRLNRNLKNLGLTDHVNRIFALANGALIVPNAGDDVSLPNRCEKLYVAFKNSRAPLLYSDHYGMTNDGQIKRIRSFQRHVENAAPIQNALRGLRSVLGATCAWSPELYEVFGPLQVKEAYEDAVFFTRAKLLGQVIHVPEPLILYRDGGMSRADHSIKSEFRRKVEGRIKKKTAAIAILDQRQLDLQAFAQYMSSAIADERRDQEEVLDRLNGRIANWNAAE